MQDAISRATGLLTATRIDKSFGANRVLRSVSLTLAPGEVHTLMGENGAGKSTLFRILAGIHQPDAGQINLDGTLLELRNPCAAYDQGIYLVPRVIHITGYSRFSLTRASAVVNCQSALVWF